MTPVVEDLLARADEVVAQDLDYVLDRGAREFEQLAGKDVLLTGGAGFLGYYLVQAIVRWNARTPERRIGLTVYDNYLRGTPEWLTGLGGDGVTLVTHDMRMPLPDDIPDFDYIVHAAGIASPTYYRQFPIETMDANIGGLRALLDHARLQAERGHAISGLLFFSSSEIYGDPSAEFIPTPEDYRGNVSCTGPRACYDESKRYGETLCVNFARQYELPITIARPFNNYGPGLKITDRRVIPDLARDALTGRDIVLLSDGSATRTFCYVADAVVGYYKVLVRGRAGEPYNVGVEAPEISMRELADRVAAIARDLWGYRGTVTFGESDESAYLVDNPNRRCPVIDKARADLGYDPAVSLDDGLVRTLTWYAANRDGVEA